MSWSEYHERRAPVTFGEHVFAYRKALLGLAQMDASILDTSSPKKILLGGFHNAWTVAEFKQFCQELFPNSYTPYLLDMNRKPLQDLDSVVNPNRVQSALESLPFKSKSLDLIFLDFTFGFMNPKQIRDFFLTSQNSLTDSGLILASYVDNNDVNIWDKIQSRYSEAVAVKYHRYKELCKLANPMKPVFHAVFDIRYKFSGIGSLAVFTQPDSKIQRTNLTFNLLQRR